MANTHATLPKDGDADDQALTALLQDLSLDVHVGDLVDMAVLGEPTYNADQLAAVNGALDQWKRKQADGLRKGERWLLYALGGLFLAAIVCLVVIALGITGEEFEWWHAAIVILAVGGKFGDSVLKYTSADAAAQKLLDTKRFLAEEKLRTKEEASERTPKGSVRAKSGCPKCGAAAYYDFALGRWEVRCCKKCGFNYFADAPLPS